MNKQFIKIGDRRMRLSNIKSYEPLKGSAIIRVFYNASSFKSDYKDFSVSSVKVRNRVIKELDDNLL